MTYMSIMLKMLVLTGVRPVFIFLWV